MAETNIEKKYFLDLGGLKTLWGKISRTFANKTEVESAISQLNTSIGDVAADLESTENAINLRIDGVVDTVDSFTPREYENYTAAVNGVRDLVPGTVIKILTDSPLTNDLGTPVEDENGLVAIYKAGLYVVLDNKSGSIEKLSTASGSGSGENIEEIAVFVDQLNKDAVKEAIVVDEHGTQLSEVNKEGNTLVYKLDDTFVVDSTSVNALTHKAVAVMYGELYEKITAIPKFKIEVVDALPNLETDEISLSTIYLVKTSAINESTHNLYAEYICTEKTTENGKELFWEKLGEQSLAIEDFAKLTDVEAMIATAMQGVVKEDVLARAIEAAKAEVIKSVEENYITKTDAEKFIDANELNSSLSNYYNKGEADNLFLTTDWADSLYAKKTDIEDFLTEDDIIISITEGNIGESIRIDDSLINALVIENNN